MNPDTPEEFNPAIARSASVFGNPFSRDFAEASRAIRDFTDRIVGEGQVSSIDEFKRAKIWADLAATEAKEGVYDPQKCLRRARYRRRYERIGRQRA